MRKGTLYLFIILFFLFLIEAFCQPPEIAECVKKAKNYINSIHNGTADITLVEYFPHSGKLNDKGLYMKRIWRIGYAFDCDTNSVRIDKKAVSAVLVKLAEDGTSETIVSKFPSFLLKRIEPTLSTKTKKPRYILCSFIGFERLSFFHNNLKVTILEDPSITNRSIDIEQNWTEESVDIFLRHPLYWSSIFLNFLKSVSQDRQNASGEFRKFSVTEDNLHHSNQAVVRYERLVQIYPQREETSKVIIKWEETPKRALYSNLIRKFWINKTYGYIEKVISFHKVLPEAQIQFTNNTYSVSEKANKLDLGIDLELKYSRFNSLPFPVEVIKKSYVPKQIDKYRVVNSLDTVQKYYFDNVKINVQGFGVSSFFLYPEKDTKIFLKPENTELSREEYFRLFSELPVDRNKVVLRNRSLIR
ncbi:hypothetical protein J7M23_01745 [Candidatus Sumerlaeota bacterium]|nr:hypothetical protein [Candidatus Sumerlaeota bacterium]